MSDATFTHPTFLYLKGEGRLFQTGEAIPADAEGWSDTPAGFVPDSADKPLTVPELAEALAHTPAVGGQAADFVLPPPEPAGRRTGAGPARPGRNPVGLGGPALDEAEGHRREAAAGRDQQRQGGA
jgi:hypothetical protein